MNPINTTIEIPPFVRFIINRLHSHSHEAFIVGGAVRDILMGKKATDWDVTTSASSVEIKRIFSDVKYFSIKHDTVTLVSNGKHYEITPYRGADKKSLVEDLGHRDFTINAIAYDITCNQIIDPFKGSSDISRKLIRAVKDAKRRFSEDPLRLMRAVRFATDFRFKIHPHTLEAISEMSKEINRVPRERLRDELIKMLLTRTPSRAIHLIRKTGLLVQFLPELLEGYLKRQNNFHRYTIFRHIMETLDQVERDQILRLTALLHDIAKPRVRTGKKGNYRFLGHEKESAKMAKEILLRLKFSNEEISKVCNLIENHMIGYNRNWTDGAVRRLIKRVGPDQVYDLIKFRRADLKAHGLMSKDLQLLDELEARVKRELEGAKSGVWPHHLAIDGNTVMKILGIQPGPKVGNILDKLTELVMEHPELNNPEYLTKAVKQFKDI